MLEEFDLRRNLVDPFAKVTIGAIVDVFVPEAVARIVELELCFKFSALGIQPVEIDVVHIRASILLFHIVGKRVRSGKVPRGERVDLRQKLR